MAGIRRKNIRPKQREEVMRLLAQGEKPGQVASITKISTSSVYKIQRDAACSDTHQEELQDLINAWVQQLKWPSPENFPEAWGDVGTYCRGDFCWEVFDEEVDTGYPLLETVSKVEFYPDIEEVPKFKMVREHLKNHVIMRLYEQWKTMGRQYWYASKVLRIRKEEMLQNSDSYFSSYTEELEETERLTRELTEVRRQIASEVTKLLESRKFPGRCSQCKY